MPNAPSPKEIRDRFSDYQNEWRDIYEEARTDMRYVAGDPWDPEDRKAREDAGRPCIAPDELSQYLNQAINNIRQNKRAIQVTPVGDGANDKDANRRANLIRGIEYKSKAQTARITAFENALQRSFGFERLTTQYVDDESFEQEIRIKRIPNPETVLLDPDYKEADASDVEHAFVTDLLRHADFKKKYPKARAVSFSGENAVQAPLWVRENYVQVAEFWQVNKTRRQALLVESPTGPMFLFEDEMRDYLERMGMKSIRGKDGKFGKARDQVKILKERPVDERKVVQYLTNGIEILDEVPWSGSWIPIIACFGKEIYVDSGSGAKRMLMSMVRLARDPQMLFAYLATLEAEEAGMTPKTPFVGYKGQFESDQEAWEFLTKVPRAYVQVDPITDAAGGQVLPLPTRPQFVPNFAQYEVAKESARRSIQAAMGIVPLPTEAQKQNQKSGIALEKIQTAEATGSFHFTDNYDLMLENEGRQMNELISIIYDTKRDVAIAKADGTHGTMRINDPAYEVQNPGEEHMHVVDEEGEPKGTYGETISTGPSYQSQREQASSFVDLLLTNLQALPIPPETATKILALGIRMKDLGAIGDQIAELLAPPDQSGLPPQAVAAMQQLQGQLQQLQQENMALHMERAGKQLEWQSRKEIEAGKAQAGHDKTLIDAIVKIVVAQLAAKSKATDAEAQADADRELSNLGMAHDTAHEVAMNQIQHNQALELADRNAKHAQNAAAQQAAQQAAQPDAQGAD